MNDILRPPPLRPGDHVRVVSPSGPVNETLLDTGLAVLADWRLEVSLDESVYHRDGYLAGEDHVRAGAVNRALRDTSVDAIIFSRGGYGATRILDQIDWAALRDRPKWLCGFSDITAIHLAALRHAGVQTLHGPVVKSFGLQESDLPEMHQWLFGGPIEPQHGTGARRGIASGRAIGGNLSLVVAMLDADDLPTFDDAILFVEDVGEADYRLDRLFTSLRTSRRCRRIGGLVTGQFVDCSGAYVEDKQIPSFVRGLATQVGDALDIPVITDAAFGHGARNAPFGHGDIVTIDGDGGTIRFGGSS